MEIERVRVTVRGVDLDLDVPTGDDVPTPRAVIRDMEIYLLALVAAENPGVDRVLRAFGVTITSPDGVVVFGPDPA